MVPLQNLFFDPLDLSFTPTNLEDVLCVNKAAEVYKSYYFGRP
jgi:hypothetical protein